MVIRPWASLSLGTCPTPGPAALGLGPRPSVGGRASYNKRCNNSEPGWAVVAGVVLGLCGAAFGLRHVYAAEHISRWDRWQGGPLAGAERCGVESVRFAARRRCPESWQAVFGAGPLPADGLAKGGWGEAIEGVTGSKQDGCSRPGPGVGREGRRGDSPAYTNTRRLWLLCSADRCVLITASRLAEQSGGG